MQGHVAGIGRIGSNTGIACFPGDLEYALRQMSANISIGKLDDSKESFVFS